MPDELLDLLPTGWFALGKVVVVKLREELRDYEEIIGEAILKAVPRAKSVVAYYGIYGELREPRARVIAGSRDTETIYREHGCLFKLDPLRLMFSPGNKGERIRLARLCRSSDVVVDMFAGIGYFTIPIARISRPLKLYSIEINPLAFRYLRENIVLNGVEKIVKPILGDCRRVSPLYVADRVIMGYLKNTLSFLPRAVRILKPEGGIIHYQDTAKVEECFDVLERKLKDILVKLGFEMEVLHRRKVKNYAPGIKHVALDLRVTPA